MKKRILTVCTVGAIAFLAGCKPAGQQSGEPRGRFEPSATPASGGATRPAPVAERSAATASLENRLIDLEAKTAGLEPKIGLLGEPNRASYATDSANIKVRIATAKKELAAAKPLSDTEWAARRTSLERDVMTLERDLEALTKQVSEAGS